MRILNKMIFHSVLCILIFVTNIKAQLETNGSFENSKTGVVAGSDIKGWIIQTAAEISSAPIFEIVNDIVIHGTKAIKIVVNGTGPNQWDVQLVADSIPVKKGVTYNCSVWAKCAKAAAQVNFTVGYYSTGEIKAIRPANLTTYWQKFSMQFTVAEDQKFIRAPIHFSYSTNSGKTIYIDNFQISEIDPSKKSVVVQAESGKLGNNYSILTDNKINYITPKTNYTGLTSPGDSSRIATYQITFADSGTYNLFARIRVGANGFNDDSFFYAKSFGVMKDTSSTDWFFINGLAAGGFTDTSAIVDEPGGLGNSVWKWVNVSKNNFAGGAGVTLTVASDNLNRTFQIGSREDGLDIDKIAFGKANLFFSVNALENGLPGKTSLKGVDSTLIWNGPAIASGQAKFLGNTEDPPKSIYSKYWNQITPGNAGKWASVAGSIDTTKWNWKTLDVIYNYALTNKMIFKDHTLIWGAQQPSWINGLDKTEQAKYIETWIRMVGQRYPKMDMVDVVNEALPTHNPPDGNEGRANYKDALGGNGTTGYDWVIWAFEKARKYLPNVKLLLNDYGIVNDNFATTSYLTIINLLKSRGLIDGIGVQGHRFEFEKADTSVLKSNLSKLEATGLPVYISEFDLGNLDNAGTPNDAQQLALYKKIFPIIWKHPAVKGITFWGYIDGQMWQSTCGLIRSDYTSRPAFVWLADYVKNNPTDVKKITETLPSNYELSQNYPNPFNPTTTFNYSIVKESNVKLQIFDVLGRHVQTLVDGPQTTGKYSVEFNAGNLSSGIYFYTLKAGEFTQTKKMLLIK
jgi:endo-1,4-beta-xylanase